MSFLTTEGVTINRATGIPMPTGNILICENGVVLCTTPIGEAPGGINSTPGIDPNALLNVTNVGWNQAAPGVPYGFSAPVYIGPLG